MFERPSGLHEVELFQMPVQVLCAEAGEETGENAGYEQYRQVQENRGRSDDESGHDELAQIVADSAKMLTTHIWRSVTNRRTAHDNIAHGAPSGKTITAAGR